MIRVGHDGEHVIVQVRSDSIAGVITIEDHYTAAEAISLARDLLNQAQAVGLGGMQVGMKPSVTVSPDPLVRPGFPADRRSWGQWAEGED